MTIKLIGSYGKRLGLPAYSSHQFSLTLERELTDGSNISTESAQLYKELQSSVDKYIQQAGFVPMDAKHWRCSRRQKQLILTLIDEHHLGRTEIECLTRELFDGRSLQQVNKSEASSLINLLLERVNEEERRVA
jgi:hypothetical protein